MVPYGFFIILLTVLKTTKGLQCYACSATTPNSVCETDPANVDSGTPIIECQKGQNQCCIIQRQETNKKIGEVESLFRGCQANCSVDNFVSIVGPSFTVYYTYCSQSLCNGRHGNAPIGEKNARVSERSSSAVAVSSNLFTTFLSSLYLLFYIK